MQSMRLIRPIRITLYATRFIWELCGKSFLQFPKGLLGVLGILPFYKEWVAVTPMESEDDANNSHTQFYEWRESGSQGLTDQDYEDALVSSNADSIDTTISNLSASGATRASYGMEMANKVFKNNALRKGSSRVVVFLSQMASRGQDGYETDEAGRAIAQAYATKAHPRCKGFLCWYV